MNRMQIAYLTSSTLNLTRLPEKLSQQDESLKLKIRDGIAKIQKIVAFKR